MMLAVLTRLAVQNEAGSLQREWSLSFRCRRRGGAGGTIKSIRANPVHMAARSSCDTKHGPCTFPGRNHVGHKPVQVHLHPDHWHSQCCQRLHDCHARPTRASPTLPAPNVPGPKTPLMALSPLPRTSAATASATPTTRSSAAQRARLAPRPRSHTASWLLKKKAQAAQCMTTTISSPRGPAPRQKLSFALRTAPKTCGGGGSRQACQLVQVVQEAAPAALPAPRPAGRRALRRMPGTCSGSRQGPPPAPHAFRPAATAPRHPFHSSRASPASSPPSSLPHPPPAPAAPAGPGPWPSGRGWCPAPHLEAGQGRAPSTVSQQVAMQRLARAPPSTGSTRRSSGQCTRHTTPSSAASAGGQQSGSPSRLGTVGCPCARVSSMRCLRACSAALPGSTLTANLRGWGAGVSGPAGGLGWTWQPRWTAWLQQQVRSGAAPSAGPANGLRPHQRPALPGAATASAPASRWPVHPKAAPASPLQRPTWRWTACTRARRTPECPSAAPPA